MVEGLENKMCVEWLRSLGWFNVPSCKKALQVKWQNKASLASVPVGSESVPSQRPSFSHN